VHSFAKRSYLIGVFNQKHVLKLLKNVLRGCLFAGKCKELDKYVIGCGAQYTINSELQKKVFGCRELVVEATQIRIPYFPCHFSNLEFPILKF